MDMNGIYKFIYIYIIKDNQGTHGSTVLQC